MGDALVGRKWKPIEKENVDCSNEEILRALTDFIHRLIYAQITKKHG